MKTLYKVTVSMDYVIVADDLYKAHSVAIDHYMDAFKDASSNCVEIDIQPYTEGCVDEWDSDIEPYGDILGKTTGQYLKEQL